MPVPPAGPNTFGGPLFHHLHRHRHAALALAWLLAGHGSMAGSAFFLTQAIHSYESGVSLTWPLMSYFGMVSGSLLSHAFSGFHLQEWVSDAHRRVVAHIAGGLRRRPECSRSVDCRDHYSALLARNSFSAVREYLEYLHGAASLAVGGLLSFWVIGLLLPGQLFAAYLASAALCMVVILVSRPAMQARTVESERRQMHYAGMLHRAVANLTVGNALNRRAWSAADAAAERSFQAAGRRLNRLRLQTNAWLVLASHGPTIVLLYHLVCCGRADAALLAALVVNLSRIFQLLNSLGTVVHKTLDFGSAQARIRMLLADPPVRGADNGRPARCEALELEGVAVESPADVLALCSGRPFGRFRLTGPNGCGKSGLLIGLKTLLGEAAALLPAQHGELLWDRGELTTASSAGQRTADILERLLAPGALPGTRYFLLEEWDAHLDAGNRARFDARLDILARTCTVIEARH